MHLRWLKDFVAVAQFGSFSKAADVRAITQPAMSRHIKGLEEWVGVELIDRSTFPARLTGAGEGFLKVATSTLDQLQHGVEELRREYREDAKRISFSMQHALAAEFFSRWWNQLTIDKKALKVMVEASNLHDCMQRLESRQCELLLCFRHSSVPLYFNHDKFESKVVGNDRIVPVSALDKRGRPVYDLASRPEPQADWQNKDGKKPASSLPILPLVGSAPGDFMGQVILGIINRNNASHRFNRVYEDSFSEGVRSQALMGTGLAWLPSMLVQGDIEQGRLVIVGDGSWQEPLEIRLYRRVDDERAIAQAVWDNV